MTRLCLPAIPKEAYEPLKVVLPELACDSHVHVFGPYAKYPLAEDRSYTPTEFLPHQFIEHLDQLGLARGVVVTASVCGTDNGSTIDALRAYPDRLRGVVVPDPQITDAQLEEMHAAGVRGVRVNMLRVGGHAMYRNGIGLETLEALAPRLRRLGWHAQIWIYAPDLPVMMPRLTALQLPLVVDHMGRMETARGTDDPGFKFLCELLRTGQAYCKISGADRIGTAAKGFQDALPFMQALVDANPKQLVWGTDWPHINYFEAEKLPNDGALINLLTQVLNTPELLKQVLVDTPASLYDF
jgi:predicted TIM-barrel fold metal-dependent hydrolase